MRVKTERGFYVFDPLRPFTKDLVFTSEEVLKKAKRRYNSLLAALTFVCVHLYIYAHSDMLKPDWFYPNVVIAIFLSPIAIFPMIYFLMPEKTFYNPELHGEPQDEMKD